MPVILSTRQAADLTGRDPSRIRHWVAEGRLQPIRPGARPLTFHASAVWRAARSTLTHTAVATLRALGDALILDTPAPGAHDDGQAPPCPRLVPSGSPTNGDTTMEGP